MNARGLFITGTDTGVGKTVASVALLHALRMSGKNVVGMKPVASGCVQTPEGWRNEDALALQAASDGAPAYEQVNPFALPEATAPQLAARHAGVAVSLPPMLAAYRQLAARAEMVVVEGVGGWLAPLADGLDQADLMRALGLDDVILVVGMRLGCISHARLSERAIVADGFTLKGWVANTASGETGYPETTADDYFQALASAMQAPCIGRLAFAPHALAEERATRLRLWR